MNTTDWKKTNLSHLTLTENTENFGKEIGPLASFYLQAAKNYH